jgi:uncharacterized membrane protein
MGQPDDVADSSAEDSSSELDRIAAEFLQQDAAESDSTHDSSTVSSLVAGVLMERYKGVFPHPDSLKKFDEVVANGAERAFSLTELEQKHRHSCDNKLIDAQIASQRALDMDRRIFICIASLVVLSLVITTVVLAATGASIAAGAFGLGSIITGTAGIFLLKKRDADSQK